MLGFHLNNSLKITNVNLQHLLWNQSYIDTCHILFVVVQVKDLQFSGCRLLPIQYFFSFMILNLNQEVSVLALRLSSTLWSGCWLFITIPISILNVSFEFLTCYFWTFYTIVCITPSYASLVCSLLAINGLQLHF